MAVTHGNTSSLSNCAQARLDRIWRCRSFTLRASTLSAVTVAARTANNPTVPVSVPRRDLRSDSRVRAGTFAFESGEEIITGWHVHSLHQLEYAVEGVAHVESAEARYLLPPQQAVWVPAGTRHCTTLTRVHSVAVFFDPSVVGIEAGDRIRILAVEPVLREMIRYAQRWPIDRASSDAFADGYFNTLAGLTAQALEHELPLRLPTSQDPLINEVMGFTLANLSQVSETAVCRAVGVSERTLRRVFAEATGLTWRQYLQQSRVLQAMADLAVPGRTILQIATDVGFESLSGFTRAFRRYAGQTPSDYRRSVCG